MIRIIFLVEGEYHVAYIGPRTIKTAIAVALTIWLGNIFGIESTFFAVIAAIIAIQPTLSESLNKGYIRVLGTVIGAIVGIIFSFFVHGNPIIIGLGIIVIIVICNKFHWQESIVLAGVVFISITLSTDKTIVYAVERTLSTILGIVIAVAINYLIYPPHYQNQVKSSMGKLVGQTSIALDYLLEAYKNNNFDRETFNQLEDDLYQKIEGAKNSLELYKKELGVKKVRDYEISLSTFNCLELVKEEIHNIYKVVETENPKANVSLILEDIQQLGILTINIFNCLLDNLYKDKDIDFSEVDEKLLYINNRINNEEYFILKKSPLVSIKEVFIILYSLEEIITSVKKTESILKQKRA